MAGVDLKESPLKKLFSWIKEGNVSEIKTFLKAYKKLDRKLKLQGLSALGLAVSIRNVEVVQLLLQHGVDVDVTGNGSQLGLRPIHYFFVPPDKGDRERFIIDMSNTKCQRHSSEDTLDIAKLLARAGADLNKGPCSSGCSRGYSPLMFAVSFNDLSFAKFLLDCGVDVDYRNTARLYSMQYSTALFNAAHYGYKDMVKLLLSHGADVNPPHSCMPLIACANNIEMTNLLLSHGADPNNKNKYKHNNTPIQAAFIFGNIECIQALLAHGADLTKYPNTPIKILKRMLDNYHFSSENMKFLLHVNKAIHKPEFIRNALHLALGDINNYVFFDILLNAGMSPQKVEDLGKIFELLSTTCVYEPDDFEKSLRILHIMIQHGVTFEIHDSFLARHRNDGKGKVKMAMKCNQMYSWLDECSKIPLTLQGLCRIRVREECMNALTPTQGMEETIEKLNLPVSINDFLLFKGNHLPDDWSKCQFCKRIRYRGECYCKKVLDEDSNISSSVDSDSYAESMMESSESSDKDYCYSDLVVDEEDDLESDEENNLESDEDSDLEGEEDVL